MANTFTDVTTEACIFPPSRTPLAELQPILLSDLRLETHHKGKILFVRTFGYPTRTVSCSNAIEDVQGNVDRVGVYNESRRLSPHEILPHNSVFAIKEPLYKVTHEGSSVIRVDHPSDLIRLPPGHPLIPAKFTSDITSAAAGGISSTTSDTASDHKQRGNTLYANGNHLAAFSAYTAGLVNCQDAVLRSDLLRNRSLMSLMLHRYEPAIVDATASVLSPEAMPDEHERNLRNAKAFGRAGLAHYALRNYHDAEVALEEALTLDPINQVFTRELSKAKQRLQELDSDTMDVSVLVESLRPRRVRLDHADFTKNVKIDHAGQRGRGLFATRALRTGDLIMCEKAFEMVLDRENASVVIMVCNADTGRSSTGTHVDLLHSIITRLRHNPIEAVKVLQLHAGSAYTPQTNVDIVDGQAIVDTWQVRAIMDHNAFNCDIRQAHSKASLHAPDPAFGSSGLWVLSSFVNHACVSNAARTYIGDFMILRASCDIACGEEITLSYFNCFENYREDLAELQRHWGIRCHCKVCVVEQVVPRDLLQERARLMTLIRELMATCGEPIGMQADEDDIQHAISLYRLLERTYPPAIYERRPRIELAYLSMWLCSTQLVQSVPGTGMTVAVATRSVKWARQTLRDSGFVIEDVGNTVRISNREQAFVSSPSVDGAGFAAKAYEKLGKPAAARVFLEFARLNHRILHGDLIDFVPL